MPEPPRGPTLLGWELPPPSKIIWGTIIGSTVAYFLIGRALANLIAVAGGILVTYVLIKREAQGP